MDYQACLNKLNKIISLNSIQEFDQQAGTVETTCTIKHAGALFPEKGT